MQELGALCALCEKWLRASHAARLRVCKTPHASVCMACRQHPRATFPLRTRKTRVSATTCSPCSHLIVHHSLPWAVSVQGVRVLDPSATRPHASPDYRQNTPLSCSA